MDRLVAREPLHGAHRRHLAIYLAPHYVQAALSSGLATGGIIAVN
jgi:hypothetical protein